MRLLSKRLLGSAGVLAALLLSPNVASAANAYVLGDWGYYVADAGETNEITVTFEDVEVFRILDEGATITVGEGCESVSPHEATCRVPGHGLTLDLDDQDDSASAVGVAGFIAMYGGDGNDTLDGGLAPDDLQGGAGNDTLTAGPAIDPGEEEVNYLRGGPGDDTLVGGDDVDHLYGNEGADDLSGGAGLDRTWYFESPERVVVTLDDAPGDGQSGEDDNVHSDIEWVYGSRWNDTLVGSSGNNVLIGNRGNDLVFGRGGNDYVYGGRGNDDVRGGRGHDVVRGDSGNDTLYAKDRTRDHVWGGTGFNRAHVDRGLDEVRSINVFF